MRKLKLLGVLLVVAAVLCCLVPLGTVYACVGPTYWSGTVEVNGAGVEAGTGVSAWINGMMWANTTTGNVAGYQANQFCIEVPSDDPFTKGVVEGGKNGEEVFFKIKRPGTDYWIPARIDGQESAIFYYECWFTGVLLTVDVGNLNGQVHLEGRGETSGESWVTPLTVTFLQNSTVVRALNITTDQTGAFTIDDVIPGTYDIRVKNSHTLSNLKPDVVFAAGEVKEVDFGTLLEGDANNDNVIDGGDVSLLGKNGFPKSKDEPGFIDNCDFNRDGVVDGGDLSLLGVNLGAHGDIIV